MARTIIMIHPGALGDVLLALPAIQLVRSAFSGHLVGLIAKQEVGRLLSAWDPIHAAFPIETQAMSGRLSEDKVILPELQHWLERCDVAVCWMFFFEIRLRPPMSHPFPALILLQ